jgi:hypothetical protein
MFLEKIKSAQSGILLYGITPPKASTQPERIAEIAQNTLERLTNLDIDALVVYDVQDESARTAEERPFPFLPALDPFVFASGYLNSLTVPKLIYRPAGKFSPDELSDWLDQLHQHRFYPIFVGVPAPDYPVKTTLAQAYQLWSRHQETSAVGAITIPERHNVLNDEDSRMLDKMSCGVSYFISQCVFNIDYARQVIDDLSLRCDRQQVAPPTIIFTLTACGSEKTLHFMEWLGIHVPEALKEELKASADMLEKSVQLCLDIASNLTTFCMERAIPFGFNIESVAIRKAEIEASIYITTKVGEMLREKGVRTSAKDYGVSIDG